MKHLSTCAIFVCLWEEVKMNCDCVQVKGWYVIAETHRIITSRNPQRLQHGEATTIVTTPCLMILSCIFSSQTLLSFSLCPYYLITNTKRMKVIQPDCEDPDKGSSVTSQNWGIMQSHILNHMSILWARHVVWEM